MEIQKLTIDNFLGGKLQIKQPARGYRIGIDAVLLASATKPKADAKVLDLGCGVGGISLCLLTNHLSISVVGMDLDKDLIKDTKIFVNNGSVLLTGKVKNPSEKIEFTFRR